MHTLYTCTIHTLKFYNADMLSVEGYISGLSMCESVYKCVLRHIQYTHNKLWEARMKPSAHTYVDWKSMIISYLETLHNYGVA